MNRKSEYISDKQLEELDRFLLERVDEETTDPDKDEGIIDLSELDGFFAAIVSSPEMIPPSVWLPAVWGDFEPVWESQNQAERIIGLLIEVMSSVNSTLSHSPHQYQPLFEHREVDHNTFVIVDEWCFGYMRGVGLSDEPWDLESLNMKILITPIRAFGTYDGLDLINEMKDVEIDNIKKNILPNVIEIFNLRSAKHSNKLPVDTFRRENSKVGRNEPCPCGSGKKFKKCCLH